MKGAGCNIDRKGRVIRLVLGLITLGCAAALWLGAGEGWKWGALALVGLGLFTLYEAVRGWCALRAMGVKTPW